MSATIQSTRQRNRNRPHINRGGGYSNSNSHKRDGPENEPPNSSLSGIYSDSRTAVVMCSILGTRTTVKTRNGSLYKGHTTAFSDRGDIAISDAKLEDEDGQPGQECGIVIPKDCFVVCKTNGVDTKSLSYAPSDFTDSAIAGRVNGSSETSMKELEPWNDDDVVTPHGASLDDDNSGGWEPTMMFQVNNERFNVTSTYNEDLPEYTTSLPDPGSENYEERQKLAQRQADEIERSDGYKERNLTELSDGDEESRYSAVHRPGESHAPRSHDGHINKITYTIPALRDHQDQNLRNGNASRRTGQRQNSPYSSTSQQQSHHGPSHQSVHTPRPVNNSFHPGVLTNRNQGQTHRQQQSQSINHASLNPHHHHPSQSPLPTSSQQQRPPGHHMGGPPSKSHAHHTVPSSLPQAQHPPHPAQKVALTQNQAAQAPNVKGPPPNLNQPPSAPQRQPASQHLNGDNPHSKVEVNNLTHKGMKMDVAQNPPQPFKPRPEVTLPVTAAPNSRAASSQVAVVQKAHEPSIPQAPVSVESTVVPNTTISTMASPTSLPNNERRAGRGVDNTPDSRNKVKQLQDFSKKFVLESQNGQEPSDASEENSSATTVSTSATHPSISASESTPTSTDSRSGPSPKSEKTDSSSSVTQLTINSKLNPNAKEFKPAASKPQVEAQSPSPQQRVSPHVVPQHMMQYQFQAMHNFLPHTMPHTIGPPIHTPVVQNSRKKGATVSAVNANDLAGQPLLHHSAPMIYVPWPSNQVVTVGAAPTRMVGPGPFTVQPGQHSALDQSSVQAQPQPVFMTTQQPPLPGPMPAHVSAHPQPAHAQQLSHPPNQPAQPAHIPSPSPVQHQQQQTQPHNAQPLPHPMSQGTPQPASHQQAHFPQISIQHGVQAGPRTSMSGQHGMATSGHHSVSMNYPVSTLYSFPNANVSAAQYTFAPAAQPQTSQNSGHNTGPQYVMMPQPQSHPTMQQHHHQNQPYAATGIQFQHHNAGLVQGKCPPQIPPNSAPTPNQGTPHLFGMPTGIHQQMPSTPPSMYMPAPSTLQPFQHQQ